MTEIYISFKSFGCFCRREAIYSIRRRNDNNYIGHVGKAPFYGGCHTKVVVL